MAQKIIAAEIELGIPIMAERTSWSWIFRRPSGRPYCVVAHTVKGKGVSFFENNNQWHHSKLNHQQYVQALRELEYGENGEDLRHD